MKRILVCFFLFLLISSQAFALTIKIGSIAPAGTPWDTALKQLADEWRRISGGQVILKIYSGGTVGDEADMLRKMRIGQFGQLNGAVLTGIGLARIQPDLLSLSLPFLIESDDELEYMLSEGKDRFEGLIADKGFTMVLWTKAGWINFFSKVPLNEPEDLKRIKLAVTAGDASILQAWSESGFRAIPLSTSDTGAGLVSGMVDSMYTAPIYASSMRLYETAPWMCDLKIAPLIGGIVINSRVWDQVPASLRPKLLEAARRIEASMYAESLVVEKQNLDGMIANGMKITRIDPESAQRWRQTFRAGYDSLLGKVITTETWGFVQQLLTDFRRK